MYSEPMFTIQERPNVFRTYVYYSRETQCTQNLRLPLQTQCTQNLCLPFNRDQMYSEPMFTIQERPNVLRTYVYLSRETKCTQNLVYHSRDTQCTQNLCLRFK